MADLHNAVVWMVSTCPLISKSCSPYNNPSVTVPSAPTVINISVTLMFYSFSVLLQDLDIYLSVRFPSVLSWGQPER